MANMLYTLATLKKNYLTIDYLVCNLMALFAIQMLSKSNCNQKSSMHIPFELLHTNNQ